MLGKVWQTLLVPGQVHTLKLMRHGAEHEARLETRQLY
jgi:hypothetical protein